MKVYKTEKGMVMKPYEIRQMSVSELAQRVEELEEEIYNLRFQKATQESANTSRISTLRRDIARIKTVLREHDLGIRILSGTGAQAAETSEEAEEEA